MQRTIARAEHQAVALRDEGGGAAGLGAGPLLVQQELAARMVGARGTEVDHDLEREDQLAIQVTVQGIAAAGAVAEQDRGGLGLPGGVAHVQPVGS